MTKCCLVRRTPAGQEADKAAWHQAKGASVNVRHVKDNKLRLKQLFASHLYVFAAVGNLFSYGRVEDSEPTAEVGEEFVERAKYIPVRLSYDERKQLHLLEASLSVSGYTDKLDTPTFCNKSKRVRTQLQDIAAFLTGLVVAVDYDTGQTVLDDKSFSQDAGFFQSIFELARRYKIMNPGEVHSLLSWPISVHLFVCFTEKLRGDYGKLMYLLQDANSEQIQVRQCARFYSD
jgi:hypothetical protein